MCFRRGGAPSGTDRALFGIKPLRQRIQARRDDYGATSDDAAEHVAGVISDLLWE